MKSVALTQVTATVAESSELFYNQNVLKRKKKKVKKEKIFYYLYDDKTPHVNEFSG